MVLYGVDTTSTYSHVDQIMQPGAPDVVMV